MSDEVEDREDDRREPRRKRRNPDNTKVACPKCGAHSVRSGPWPWYLGTVGAMMCKAVICNECGHEYDEKKPQAHLPTRKRNLAIGINAVGGIGILAVIGLLVVWIMYTMNPH
jgi:transcription elongation factor Elf1